MKFVGDRGWTAGPIVLGSKKLHAALCKKFTEKQAKPVARDLAKPIPTSVAITELAGETVLTMWAVETGCVHPWDNETAVLVHACERKPHYLNEEDRVAAIENIDPKTIPAKAWKKIGTLDLPKQPVLFDLCAHELKSAERKKKLEVALPLGEYVVELATGKVNAKPYPTTIVPMEYRFVRLRPPEWKQPAATKAKRVVDEGPIVASPELIAAAKNLQRASTDGVPIVMVPKQHLLSWRGIGDEDGKSDDFERACKVKGVGTIAIGKGKGLVISAPETMMFWPTDDGGLIVMWIGADSNAGCIAAALAMPETAWKREKTKLVVKKGEEDQVLIESGSAGCYVQPDGTSGYEGEGRVATFRLPAGSYTIDAVWSWNAKVKVGKKVQDTMIGALRLTRS